MKCFLMNKNVSLMAEGELAGEQCQEQNAYRGTEVQATFNELREPLLDSTCIAHK